MKLNSWRTGKALFSSGEPVAYCVRQLLTLWLPTGLCFSEFFRAEQKKAFKNGQAA